jgi:hypothetical protein
MTKRNPKSEMRNPKQIRSPNSERQAWEAAGAGRGSRAFAPLTPALPMNRPSVGSSRCDDPARATAGGSQAPLNAARTAQRAVPTRPSHRFMVPIRVQSWRSRLPMNLASVGRDRWARRTPERPAQRSGPTRFRGSRREGLFRGILSPLRGEGARCGLSGFRSSRPAFDTSVPCDEDSRTRRQAAEPPSAFAATPSPLNGERAEVRGEAVRLMPGPQPFRFEFWISDLLRISDFGFRI